MSEYIQIKKENFLKTYENSCEDVKEVLRGLCPDLTLRLVRIEAGEGEFVDEDGDCLVTDLDEKSWDEYGGKALWLNDEYNWEIKSVFGSLLLIPTRKDD